MNRWLGFVAAAALAGGCSRTVPEAATPPAPPPSAPPAFGSEPFIQRSELIQPAAAPGFRLVDHEGRAVSLEDLRGRVVLLGFIYTHCPDICRNITATYLELQKQFKAEIGNRLSFVLITTDPERDTPERLKKYTEQFGGGWTFLTGAADDLKAVWESYRVTVRPESGGRSAHTWMVVLMDPQSRIRIRYLGQDVPLDLMANDIRKMLEETP